MMGGNVGNGGGGSNRATTCEQRGQEACFAFAARTGHGPPLLSHTQRTTHSALSLAVEYGMINQCHFTLSTPAFASATTVATAATAVTLPLALVLGIVCVLVAAPRNWFLELVSDDDQVSTRIREQVLHALQDCLDTLTFRAASQA
jgi:hypothetical protein